MIELIQTYLIVSLIIYFLPFLLSLLTGNRTGSVFVINLFLGWTFIGWIWALVWAITSEQKREQIIVNNHVTSEKSNDNNQNQKTKDVLPEIGTEKTNLLNQLSQLHSLKEKNVISETIYEHEKKLILNKLQPQEQTVEHSFILGADKGKPQLEQLPIKEEDVDIEYESLFQRKKWYQKYFFWITTAVILGTTSIIWFLVDGTNNLPDPYSNKSVYKVDTTINFCKIDKELISITVLRDRVDEYQKTYSDENKPYVSESPITLLFFKKGSNKPLLIKRFAPENSDLTYRFYKGSNQNLEKEGKLFFSLNISGGGSGASRSIAYISFKEGKLTFDEVLNASHELDYILFNQNDIDILALEGIWAYGEGHFDKHRYAIYRFKYTGTYFKKTNLGETKYRYSSLDTDDAFKNVLISIKQKEQILNSVSVNEYANSYGR